MTIINKNMTIINKNYKLNEDLQSVSELWESIEKLARGRGLDMKNSDSYPLEVRQMQSYYLKVLVNSLIETEKKMVETEKENNQDLSMS